jgi:hypothetical protein
LENKINFEKVCCYTPSAVVNEIASEHSSSNKLLENASRETSSNETKVEPECPQGTTRSSTFNPQKDRKSRSDGCNECSKKKMFNKEVVQCTQMFCRCYEAGECLRFRTDSSESTENSHHSENENEKAEIETEASENETDATENEAAVAEKNIESVLVMDSEGKIFESETTGENYESDAPSFARD